MKRLITALLFTALFSVTSVAQIPMPLGNANWKYKSTSDVMVVTYYYYHSQDTAQYTFMGNDYFKVTYDTSATPTNNFNKFFLRNDTSAQQVFLYDSMTNAEYVLYDFGVVAGDTVRNIYNQMGLTPDSARVDSVVSRNLNGVSRKYIYTTSLGNPWSWGYTKIWIEGIGSTYEFASPSGHNPFNGYELICFNGNSQLLFGDTASCSSPSPNAIQAKQKSEFSLHPNPAFSNLFLTIDIAEKITVEVYNISGQLVETFKGMNAGYNQLDISGLPSGLYFLQVKTSSGVKIGQQKFLKE